MTDFFMRQEVAIRRIVELGGTVGLDGDWDYEHNRPYSGLAGHQPQDQERIVDLVMVSEFEGDVDEMSSAIESLPDLTRIRTFAWSESKVDDKTIVHLLSKMTHLEEINLSGTDVGNATLHFVIGMEQIKLASLGNTLVDDTVIAEVAAKMSDVDIYGSRRDPGVSRKESSVNSVFNEFMNKYKE